MDVKILVSATEREIEELEEDPEKFEHLLPLFKEWLRFQKHLPQNFSTVTLSHFLRGTKLNFQKAKTRFENYCYLQRTCESLFADRVGNLAHDIQILDSVYMLPLPHLAPNGDRITVCRAQHDDDIDMLSLFRCIFMLYDYRLHYDIFCNGETFILDMEHVGPQFYSKLFTPLFFKASKVAIGTYPNRFSKIFIVSCHPILEKGFNTFKNLLPEKIKNRICFLVNSAELAKHIPAHCLPSDYCGSAPSLSVLSKCWKKELIEDTEFLKKTNELKPLGPMPKHITMHDVAVGVEGSFRKLNID